MQAVVGAIQDSLQMHPAAAQSLLQEHAHEALQSPAALSLLLHALPAALPTIQAAFLACADSMLQAPPGQLLMC